MSNNFPYLPTTISRNNYNSLNEEIKVEKYIQGNRATIHIVLYKCQVYIRKFFMCSNRTNPFDEFEVVKSLKENGCNVPEYYSVFKIQCQERRFIIQEFIQGDTLNVCLKIHPKDPKDIEDNKEIMLKVIDEIRKQFSLGIYHNDLHAKNIIVTPNKDVFIIDFSDFAVCNRGRENTLMALETLLDGYLPNSEYLLDEFNN